MDFEIKFSGRNQGKREARRLQVEFMGLDLGRDEKSVMAVKLGCCDFPRCWRCKGTGHYWKKTEIDNNIQGAEVDFVVVDDPAMRGLTDDSI